LARIAELTQIPAIRTLFQVEMIARVAKTIISDGLHSLPATDWSSQLAIYFDKILGNSDEAAEFWSEILEPKISERFGVCLTRELPLLHLPQLFYALQFHTGADFLDSDDYDFASDHPVLLEHLQTINPVSHHFLVDICRDLRGIDGDAYGLLGSRISNETSLAINNRVSLLQSIFGSHNMVVASGLSLLSQTYLELGDTAKAQLCADSALDCGRQFDVALVPAYWSQISTSQTIADIESKTTIALHIVDFQLGPSHWFAADVLMAAAAACQSLGALDRAAPLAHKAHDILHTMLGLGHPRTGLCARLCGRIKRAQGRYTEARPLLEQALFSMSAVFGDDSVAVGDCLFEIADVLVASGRLNEALDAAAAALKVRRANFAPSDTVVLESVRQLAEIYDALGRSEMAHEEYGRLLDFLRGLEDESGVRETVKIVQKMLTLLFRTVGASQRRVLNQIKRKDVDSEAIRQMFETLVEGDPVGITQGLFEQYQATGNPEDFDALALVWHVAVDDLLRLDWCQRTD
jgi:tetratricopeptide (TPR) repeat protein